MKPANAIWDTCRFCYAPGASVPVTAGGDCRCTACGKPDAHVGVGSNSYRLGAYRRA